VEHDGVGDDGVISARACSPNRIDFGVSVLCTKTDFESLGWAFARPDQLAELRSLQR
jgi:hypothetical protein